MNNGYTGDLFSMATDDQQQTVNPFQNRRLAVIGSFTLDTKVIKQRFMAMGCTIDNKVTRHTHYALVSNTASESQKSDLNKVRNVRGWDIRVLSEADLNSILSGWYDGYATAESVVKNLHLTYDHYAQRAIVPEAGRNPVLEENVYVPRNIISNRDILCQIIGNIGAYANDEIVNESESDKTKPIILLGDDTIEHLHQGTSDDVIRYIEQTYNASRSDGLNYEFISLASLLTWIKDRCTRCGDELTLSLLQSL